MARKGRELEELVATLEKGLGGTGIRITSPDHIVDRVLEEKREVDVSLKFNMGSNEFLVVMECRDRKGVPDVTWIEQLATKRDDICVDKLIAVSSNGFSKNARKKAHAKNIELRTLKEIDPKEIMEWFQPTELTIHNQRYNVLSIRFVTHESLDKSQIEELDQFIKSFSSSFPLDNKFIIDSEVGHALSISDFITGNEENIFEDIKSTNEKVIKPLTIIPLNKEAGFFALIHSNLIRMERINLKLEIWLEVKEAKIASVSSYDNEKNPLAQIISFEDIEIGGVKRSFKIHLTTKDDVQRLEFHGKDLD